jgi:hypothetical protein
MPNIQVRFWGECALAGLAAVIAVLTAIWPDWIELLFGADPDGGDGSAEWGVVVAFAVIAILFALVARFEFKRLPASSKPA